MPKLIMLLVMLLMVASGGCAWQQCKWY
jgi:hypothetical protein